MKNIISFVVLLSTSFAIAAPFTADSVHSNIDFTIRHIISKVRGSFTEMNGNLNFDEKKMELSDTKFTVNASSVNTQNAKRDEHLKAPDFFNVAKFPTIEFVQTKAAKIAGSKGTLEGTITLLGVTKPAKWNLEYLGATKDMQGNPIAAFTAKTTVKRSDFNMSWNKVLDAGKLALSDEIELNVNIEAAAAKAETAPAKK